jgi:UDP-N-acetylglucosamine enolpyruvyl transferase
MDRISISGGRPLNGTIPISGAKNAALPLIIASLLTSDRLTLKNVPNLADVKLLTRILRNHDRRQARRPLAVPGRDHAFHRPRYRRHHRAL